MANEIITPPKREIIAVQDAIPLFDTAAFEHMNRIAMRMARASILPDHLKVKDGPDLDIEATIANCLVVVNQARNWMMDPYAVAQCMSLVHGKPCYEGKLIAAVIETKLGVKLKYEWFGEPGTDGYGITIWDEHQPERRVKGTVGEWKTKDKQGNTLSQWSTANSQYRMLKYRGDREWCRLWEPALMLGVYSDDELEELREDARARRARPIGGNADTYNPLLDGAAATDANGKDRAHGAADETQHAAEDAGQGAAKEKSSPAAGGSGGNDKTEPKAEQPASDKSASTTKPEQRAPAEGAEAAAKAKADGGKGEAKTAVAASPDLLLRYSKTLWRAMTVKTLEKCSHDFSESVDATTIDAETASKMADVLAVHRERCENMIDEAKVDQEIKRIVGK